MKKKKEKRIEKKEKPTGVGMGAGAAITTAARPARHASRDCVEVLMMKWICFLLLFHPEICDIS